MIYILIYEFFASWFAFVDGRCKQCRVIWGRVKMGSDWITEIWIMYIDIHEMPARSPKIIFIIHYAFSFSIWGSLSLRYQNQQSTGALYIYRDILVHYKNETDLWSYCTLTLISHRYVSPKTNSQLLHKHDITGLLRKDYLHGIQIYNWRK